MRPICHELARVPLWTWYVLIAAGAFLSYRPAKDILILQEPWMVVLKSPVTVNFVLFLFLWGVAADKATKHMDKKKGWLIWATGFAAIILTYRFIGGHGTIFG